MSKLKDAGISTLAKVAFVSSSAHGAASDAERIKALDEELKTTAERPDEAGPRRLSQPERGERFRKIKLSVSGIDIKDRNGPSDALLDLCVSVYEGDRLRYVSWGRRTPVTSSAEHRRFPAPEEVTWKA